MANTSTTGYGCRAIETVGNTPATQGQSRYSILSGLGVRILKNEPIGPQDGSGDDGYMQSIAPATMDDTGTGGASWDADTTTPEVCPSDTDDDQTYGSSRKKRNYGRLEREILVLGIHTLG